MHFVPMTERHKALKVFRIVDNVIDDERAPYALLDESDTVIRVASRPSTLSDIAFDLGADEVRHDEDLVKAEDRFRMGAR